MTELETLLELTRAGYQITIDKGIIACILKQHSKRPKEALAS